jgi:CubicO group peptidase (beta-lactamase class C family)
MTAVDVQGFVRSGFEPVRAAFAANFAEGLELGAGFAALQDGEVIVQLWAGHADRAQTRPWTPDTLAPVYSTTKPAAALVVARLVDQGLMDYEASVASIWPAFGAHGKDRVTVAQSLSHQAGVAGFIEPIDPALWLDPPALAEALAGLAPMWPPGEAAGYHPQTFGYLAGEMVRRVAGRSLGTILREEIAGPAGIDFHIGLEDGQHHRCAEMVLPKEYPELGEITPIKRAAFMSRWSSSSSRGGPEWRRLELPSVNGHGGALSVAQLYGAFAERGRVGDQQVWSREVMAAMTRRRWLGQDLVLPWVSEYAAGAFLNNLGLYGPNPETIAHAGWGGSFGFGDPARRLSAGYVMNRQSNSLQGDPRAQRLIKALFGCLD